VARHQTLGFGTVAGVVVPLRSVAHGRVVLVLVGSVSSGPAVSLLCGVGDVLSRHACGRPWIIGQHRSNALQLLDFGPRRVAILGECLDDINRLATANGVVNQLMDVLSPLPGSFHIVIPTPPDWPRGRYGRIPLGTRTYAYSRRAPVG
jgi:hypothetical protein